MKIFAASLAGSLLLAGGVAIAGPALAQPPGPPPMFADMDSNRDGAITRAEAQAGALKRFEEADTDRNGTISAAERTAMRTRHMERRFSAMDTDGNGQLSAQEYAQAREAMAERKARGHGGDRRHAMKARDVTRDQALARANRMFDRIDANKDGKITGTERDAAMAKMRQRWEQRRGDRPEG